MTGPARHDLLLLDDAMWVVTAPTGVPIYDFPFDPLLPCRRPLRRPRRVEAAARIGAFDDYARQHAALAAEGVSLVHDPDEHLRVTRLPRWYPLLADLTPRSLVFTSRPDARDVGDALGWPVFLKGERQTSRHRKDLAVARTPGELERALDAWAHDEILGWQGVVCRELVPLRPVIDPCARPERISPSFEFRTFWWRGELVGFGRYWWAAIDYRATDAERAAAVSLAREAARRLAVRFVVVDVAQTADGRWIVIECNDGQESGYGGVAPLALWERVVEVERAARARRR